MVGMDYTLAFDVDVEKRGDASERLSEESLFSPDVEEVTLIVQLDSSDFVIAPPERTRPLRIPRTGKSRGKARFDIRPTRNGRATLTATFHKEGNLVQQMEISLSVGPANAEPIRTESLTTPLSAVATLEPRTVGMTIVRAAGGGYDCTAFGEVATRVTLPIDRDQLGAAIDAARKAIMQVVQMNGQGGYVFQKGIDIPAAEKAKALEILMPAGARLFQQIFYHPAAGPDTTTLGDWLKEAARDSATHLKLQVVAADFPVPWGLLYVGDTEPTAVKDWKYFLGMRHIIEQIPLQKTLSVRNRTIPSDHPELAVSVNVNSGIDAQMNASFVADQERYWNDAKQARGHLGLTQRTTRDEVLKALASGNTSDQILYLYCHAQSEGLDARGGPDASCLIFTGDEKITLGELNLSAPTSTKLKGNPLVFINACESAELSPMFYDGFVPYFMAKGARGVIGTECKTPALFAVEWAQRFFDRFLDGDPLGEVFLELRQEFLEQHGNPLGLLYAVHCNCDTDIKPALTVPGSQPPLVAPTD